MSVETEEVPFGPDARPWSETLAEAALNHGQPVVSAPAREPSPEEYRPPQGTSLHTFQVPSTGLTPEQHAAALAQIKAHHRDREGAFLGFQANQDFPHLVGLEEYLQCQLNNLGDPFREGSFGLNTKWLERSVLDYYASLWNARWPHDPADPESYWGYVLSMGSTEGNLYGLWNAREYLAGGALLEDPAAEEEARRASLRDDRPHPVPHRLIYSPPPREANRKAYQPLIFYSQDTHYSIQKAVRALKIRTFTEEGRRFYPFQNPLAPGEPWPEAVPSYHGEEGPGSIDVEKLAILVEFFAREGYPILVFLNYGTTFKGAYDDVEAAGEALMPILKKHGLYERKVHPRLARRPDVRNGFWFHVDGALGAAYMPFVEMAYNAGSLPERGPTFDFRLPYVHSITMSGHKWIGAPWPCGIYMTKTRLQLKPPSNPKYVKSPDTTFAGSRNGFSALLLWNFVATHSYEKQIDRIVDGEELAAYTYQRLFEVQRRLDKPLWVARTPCTLTIRFKAPSLAIQEKYSLSGETLYVNGKKREYCHLFLMPHVTRELIDALIEDLSTDGAIPDQEESLRRGGEGLGALPVALRDRVAALLEVVGEDVWIDTSTSSVLFRSPQPEIVARYSLSVETLYVGGQKRRYSRLSKLPEFDLEAFKMLVLDLRRPDAFAVENEDEDLLPLPEDLSPEEMKGYFDVARVGRGFK